MRKRQVKLEDNDWLVKILHNCLCHLNHYGDIGADETEMKEYLALAKRLVVFEGSVERVVALVRVLNNPIDPHRVTRCLGEDGNKWLESLNTPK